MTHHNEEDILTATHEAGHAVAFFRLGIDLKRVTIQPGKNMSGHTLVTGSPIDPLQAIKRVIGDLSGHAALVVAGYGPAIARDGAGHDFNNAKELITEWALPGPLKRWKAVAVTLMRTPQNIAAVELVAEELLARETLSGKYAEALVEKSDGLPEHVFKQYVSAYCPEIL